MAQIRMRTPARRRAGPKGRAIIPPAMPPSRTAADRFPGLQAASSPAASGARPSRAHREAPIPAAKNTAGSASCRAASGFMVICPSFIARPLFSMI